MSKRPAKSQASSSRAVTGAGFGGFGGASSQSSLSYLTGPADFTAISDANVVVAFKNLSKKDQTTKAKALEDLRSYVVAHPYEKDGGVEDAILEAWTKSYPRISIENSRRVRELSHSIQSELIKSARKRMEKHLPKTIAAWLAGTYDRDRQVSKVAQDGFGELVTKDKALALWKKCQTQILQFAQEAIKETPETLSDERNVSPDDAEAKYERVISASLSLVLNLLLKLDKEEIAKHQDDYDEILLDNPILWSFASSKDSFVRRTLFQLVSVCIDKQHHVIENDLEMLSSALIADGMRSTQSGSALQLIQTLIKVTDNFPEIWTSSYKSKKSAISRLKIFVKKGSQGGVWDYWISLTLLMKKLPPGFLPTDVDGSLEFLEAIQDGIMNKDETPTNATASWNFYLQVAKLLSTTLTTPEDPKYLNTSIHPMFEQYIRPSQNSSRWNLGSSALSICAKAYTLCASIDNASTRQSLDGEWLRISELVVTDMLTSLPEQSKDFEKSQQAVAAEAEKLFTLESEILKLGTLSTKHIQAAKHSQAVKHSQAAKKSFLSTTEIIVCRAVEILSTRNGKPYGAASVLESALRLTPEIFKGSPIPISSVSEFISEQLPKFIFSPSAKHLIRVLTLLRSCYNQEEMADQAWNSTLDGILSALDNENSTTAVQILISDPVWGQSAESNPGLQDLFMNAAVDAVHDDEKSFGLLEAALSSQSISEKTAHILIGKTLTFLSTSNAVGALKVLEMISHKQPHLIQSGSTNYLTILTKLLSLAENSDSSVKARVSALRSIVEKTSPTTVNTPTSELPIVHIIQQNLETAVYDSLSIDTLVQQAQTLSTDEVSVVSQLFPSPATWLEHLEPLLSLSPNPSVALTNPLGGAVFLVESPNSPPISRPLRDASGFSIPFRMALYTVRMLGSSDTFSTLPLDSQVEIMYPLLLTVQLAADQLDLGEKNKLWASLSPHDPSIAREVNDFVTSARSFLVDHLTDVQGWAEALGNFSPQNKQLSFIPGLIDRLLNSSKNLSPTSFYSARSLATILHRLSVLHGSLEKSDADAWIKQTKILSDSSTSPFAAAAILCGLKLRTPGIEFFANRLISEVPGLSITAAKTLAKLVLINSTLEANGSHDDDQQVFKIAKNRVVFAVKEIVGWMNETEDMNAYLAAEAARALRGLFPYMQDTYGSYWENALVFCTELWSQEFRDQRVEGILPALYETLALVEFLKALDSREDIEPNDDLHEALKESEEAISHALIHLLELPRSEKQTTAAQLVDTSICTKAAQIPLRDISDISDIYSFVGSENQKVAFAGYSILHRAIPKAQEQISADVILEKKDAQLPEELLSLLLDAPSVSQFTEEVLSQFPAAIRTFLYAWLLIYDGFTTASYKVRTDYSEVLRSGSYIDSLLTFLFEYLGHADADPINLEKEKVTEDDIKNAHIALPSDDQEASQERSLQLTLIHLYYLCLKYTPSLAKNWWIDCKSKQTRIAVESWTEKYFSPLIISETLDEVAVWGENQEPPENDEKELVVKVSSKSREVYASYEVDETAMQIVIRLPAIYPLEGVKVDGINRVAVSEKKWQSWLMVTQGVITFSNGSITDGLSIFRKNITGALEGQTECAICYSIISGDKKMPDKRCQTCKNLFHSACLFKWFNTSNQSSCPLCRNPFNYGARK